MHSILRQQAAQFVAVGGCGCLCHSFCIIPHACYFAKHKQCIAYSRSTTFLLSVAEPAAAWVWACPTAGGRLGSCRHGHHQQR